MLQVTGYVTLHPSNMSSPRSFQDEKKSIVLNGEVVGIEIGAHIANLTDTIDIEYRNVDKVREKLYHVAGTYFDW